MTDTADQLQQAVTTLKGVGPAMAEHLARLQIHVVQDLLFHLPLRYEDRTRLTPIGALRPGISSVFEGAIDHVEIKFSGARGRRASRRMLLCHLSDNTGGVVLRFFHFSKAQQQQLSVGQRLSCFGEARFGANSLEVAHPEYRLLKDDADVELTDRLTPVYPKTERVSQTLLRSLVAQAFDLAHRQPPAEYLPRQTLDERGLPTLMQALETMHSPSPDMSMAQFEAGEHPAQQRLVLEEMVAHQLSLAKLRERVQQNHAQRLPLAVEDRAGFEDALGFSLTSAQSRVIDEIMLDMNAATPMLRLLQGDVGSGKTVVAAVVALAAINNKVQVAIMAPTEILADQHLKSFREWFPQDCILLTGKDKGQQRADKLEHIREGRVSVVIGTHALFQNDVEFASLCAVVVDEQHRFGVHQRLALAKKARRSGLVPHQLIMTATPIPRSLAMTAYADLDYSVIDELPAGRKPVKTVVLPNARRGEIMQRIADACRGGEQAYWVCTLVEESDVLQCQAAEDAAQQLTQELDGVRVGLVHGRMKQQQKDEVVERFKNRELELLVATTVIEVGVNVPNASLMIIENAERLGLAQLHQLRGRVGRGSRQSACVLMYQSPLSDTGKQRLAILRETNDGFIVAQKDLELRGPGEVLGTRQTGDMQMRIADIIRDERWIATSKKMAEELIATGSPHTGSLIRRWLGVVTDYAST